MCDGIGGAAMCEPARTTSDAAACNSQEQESLGKTLLVQTELARTARREATQRVERVSAVLVPDLLDALAEFFRIDAAGADLCIQLIGRARSDGVHA